MADCYSCSVATAYLSNAGTYVEDYLNVVQGPIQDLFTALALVWIIIQGGIMLVSGGNAGQFLIRLFFVAIGYGILNGMDAQFVSSIFQTTVDTMFLASAAIMGVGGGGNASNTASALIQGVEQAFQVPIDMATTLIESASWMDIVIISLYAAVLIVPFIFMLVQYVRHCAVGLFRVTLVCIASPFIVAISAFSFGRQLWSAAISALLGSILTLFFVTTVFSLIIRAIQAPLQQTQSLTSESLTSTEFGTYLMAVILAWSGVALVSEAASLANQFAGSALASIGGINIPSMDRSSGGDKGSSDRPGSKDKGPDGEPSSEQGEGNSSQTPKDDFSVSKEKIF